MDHTSSYANSQDGNETSSPGWQSPRELSGRDSGLTGRPWLEAQSEKARTYRQLASTPYRKRITPGRAGYMSAARVDSPKTGSEGASLEPQTFLRRPGRGE